MKAELPFELPDWANPYVPEFERLESAIGLSDKFVLFPLEVPGRDAASLLAQWLSSRGHQVRVVEPRTETEWKGLAGTLLSHKGGIIVMIGAKEPAVAIDAGLARVNFHRDGLGRQFGGALIWCGTRDFMNRTWERAPDFWSVADIKRRLPEVILDKMPFNAYLLTFDDVGDWSELWELYKAAKAGGDTRNAIRIGTQLLQSLRAQAQDVAERVAEELISLLDKVPDAVQLQAAFYLEYGVVEYWSGRAHHALDDLKRAVELFQASGDRSGEAEALIRLGAITHQFDGPLEHVVDSYLAARRICEEIHDEERLARVLGLLARVFEKTDRFSEAEETYQATRELAKRGGLRDDKRALLGLSDIARRQGRFSEAFELARSALPVAGEDTHLVAEAHGLLGRIALDARHAQRAVVLVYRGILSLGEIPPAFVESHWRVLANALETTGDLPGAAAAFRLAWASARMPFPSIAATHADRLRSLDPTFDPAIPPTPEQQAADRATLAASAAACEAHMKETGEDPYGPLDIG